MIELADILRLHGKEYLDKYGQKMPPSHRKTISDIVNCRTPTMGGQLFFCDSCQQYHYSYHSCGNRNCNKCQNDLAENWLENANGLLLPVPHFLVTFTLPASLRKYARSNQKLFYHLLLKNSTEALQTLAYDPKFVGGKLAMLAVLHTWGRDLSYHPHVHLVVPGGGLFEDENLWLPAQDNFLVPVKALSVIFHAKFRDTLKKHAPEIFNTIPKQTWQQQWVVHCKPVGNGQATLKYLAQYIFRPAISNNRILKFDHGKVTFRYKDSNTEQWKIITLSTLEFIRRYLQHVLPKGFVKVRYYGLFSFKYKKVLAMLKTLLSPHKKQQTKDEPKTTAKHKPMTCPTCGKGLRLIREIRKGEHWTHAPPLITYPVVDKPFKNKTTKVFKKFAFR